MVEAVQIPVEENHAEVQDLETRFDLKTFDELKYFALELVDMVDEGKEIDLGKAARNAKYLADIARRMENIKAGKCVTLTFEDLERLIHA